MQSVSDSLRVFQPEDSISEAEVMARRLEVQQLVAAMKNKDLTDEQLNEIVKRIGQIGQAQDASGIIDWLNATKVNWVVKENSLESLGKLGGPEAQAFLIKELTKEMPRDIDLDYYGDIQATLRSNAAVALGRCGDESTIDLLVQLSNDESQFKRVREACLKAIRMIKNRSSRAEE